jgi:hypothetical protein
MPDQQQAHAQQASFSTALLLQTHNSSLKRLLVMVLAQLLQPRCCLQHGMCFCSAAEQSGDAAGHRRYCCICSTVSNCNAIRAGH